MSRTYRRDPDHGDKPVLEKQARQKRRHKVHDDYEWKEDKPRKKLTVNDIIEEMIKAGSLG